VVKRDGRDPPGRNAASAPAQNCSPTYLETTIWDVLAIFTVLAGRNGRINWKLYWTFTFTVLPGLLLGDHVVVTVMEFAFSP
jgi:hypothetical protein